MYDEDHRESFLFVEESLLIPTQIRYFYVEHLHEFNKILAGLQNLNIEIANEDETLLLLNSLRDSYEILLPPSYMKNLKLDMNCLTCLDE